MDAALMTVMQIHLTEPEGDVLLFLTGGCSTLAAWPKSIPVATSCPRLKPRFVLWRDARCLRKDRKWGLVPQTSNQNEGSRGTL
jgi:hypothetical protein